MLHCMHEKKICYVYKYNDLHRTYARAPNYIDVERLPTHGHGRATVHRRCIQCIQLVYPRIPNLKRGVDDKEPLLETSNSLFLLSGSEFTYGCFFIIHYQNWLQIEVC